MVGCILLGAPGSGKGTQAKRLQSILGIPHISTGDILRQEIERGSVLGIRVKDIMSTGKLVDDALMTELVEARFSKPDVKFGYVLDGFPRTSVQAEALEKIFEKKGMIKPRAIQIEVPQAELMKRLLGRLSCKECGAAFHREFNPPKKDMICDQCGAGLVQRKDDTKETVTKRLEVYENETAVLLKYYKDKGVLVEVNGLQPMENITKAIEMALGA